MIRFRVTLTGTAPLLMHNARLANPIDPATKSKAEIANKRRKTDDDHHELARREFLGGLYIDPDVGPYIPGQNIERAILDAARLSKNGRNIERGVFIETDINPLWYRGPRTADELWKDENFWMTSLVVQQRNRVPRTRPKFSEWSVSADGVLDPSQLDYPVFEQIVHSAGQLIGLGDWRPRYGRFTAELERTTE